MSLPPDLDASEYYARCWVLLDRGLSAVLVRELQDAHRLDLLADLEAAADEDLVRASQLDARRRAAARGVKTTTAQTSHHHGQGGNRRDWRAFTVWVVEPHEWGGAASGAYDVIVLDRDPVGHRERDWLWQVVRPRLKPGGRMVRTLDRVPSVPAVRQEGP